MCLRPYFANLYFISKRNLYGIMDKISSSLDYQKFDTSFEDMVSSIEKAEHLSFGQFSGPEIHDRKSIKRSCLTLNRDGSMKHGQEER